MDGNNTTDIPQGTIDIISITFSIFIVTLIGGILLFAYKKCLTKKLNIDGRNRKFTIDLFIYVFAVFLISFILIAITGEILKLYTSFTFMLLFIVLYIGLATVFYILHNCYIVHMTNT